MPTKWQQKTIPSMRWHGCFGVPALGSVNNFPPETPSLRRGGGRFDHLGAEDAGIAFAEDAAVGGESVDDWRVVAGDESSLLDGLETQLAHQPGDVRARSPGLLMQANGIPLGGLVIAFSST
jgi:hypothetical protein